MKDQMIDRMNEEREKINKECYNCGWQGNEENLVSKTGLKVDVEYIYCPSCWSDNVGDMKQINLIEKMGEYIAESTGTCPLDVYEWEIKGGCEKNCEDNYQKCWIEYIKNIIE